ncbi:unnamed protein product, partial [Mesorhabditis belari]|uniref:Fungal lipase-type domain-containing protein n=1 Tax=Mesorhabditis belari TaxID=2138241 RepID=A0AAF3FTX4_9BILA
MAVSNLDQQIILWIPGSKDFSGYIRENWKLINEQFRSNLWKEFQKDTNIGEFWSIAYRDFFHESNLKSIIEKKIKSQQEYCNYNLMLAGHSVGGAMAELLALFIVKERLWPKKRLKLFTFAAPRVGDENYAAMLIHLFPWKYRYVWEDDPLVNIPPNECFNTKQRSQLNANWDLERKEKCFFHSGKTLFGKVFNGMADILKVLYDDYDGITPGREPKYDGYKIEDPQYFENYLCCESDSECGRGRICEDNECRSSNIYAWNITGDTPIRTTTSTKSSIIPPTITTTTQIGDTSSTSTTVPITTAHESHKCILNDILDQPAGGSNSVDEQRALYLLLNFSSPDFEKDYNTYNDFYMDILNKTVEK